MVKLVGNGTAEKGKCLGVQCLQGTGGEIHGQLTGHVQILIKNKVYFLVGLSVLFDQAGTGMDLDPASATNGHIRIHTGSDGGAFLHILLTEDAQIAGRDQLAEGNILKIQPDTGEKIHIPKSNPVEKGRLVDLDEGR